MNTGNGTWALAGLAGQSFIYFSTNRSSDGVEMKRALAGLVLVGVAYFVGGKPAALATGAGFIGGEALQRIIARP